MALTKLGENKHFFYILLISVFFVLCVRFIQAKDQFIRNGQVQVVKTKELSVELSKEGQITAVLLRDGTIRKNLSGSTRLCGCVLQGNVIVRKQPGGAVEFEKKLINEKKNKCLLREKFIPLLSSIRWEIEIVGTGEPWSTTIETCLQYPDTDRAKFWTSWGGSRQGALQDTADSSLIAMGILPRASVGDWSDPLVPVPFANMTLYFGAPQFNYDNPLLGFCPFQVNLFCIPLATIIEDEKDLGLSLVLSPDDALLDMTLSTSASGEIIFSRLNHRIGGKKALKFAMDLVAHEGDWRGGLRWMTQRYPRYFNPANPEADELAGTGAYSAYEGELDVAKMKKMAFRVNWKASFDFPYMGMFLAPVGDIEQWTRFGGGLTSISHIREYSQKMREHGFYVLSYFNVTEFGTKVFWPPPQRKAQDEADLWKDPNDFIYGKLAEAILYIPSKVSPEDLKFYPRIKLNGPYFTWEYAIVLDPGEPVYQSFLLDQARRHIEEIPDSAGICIDRMDWLRMYNERRDDGVSWFDGKPARAMVNSWRELMAKLGPMMHNAGKVIFVNNHTKRVDLLRHVDGFFDEFTYRGVPLNLTAFLGINKSALGWTSDADDLKPDPDAFFQKYLYMGVYPMAPFPENDHSLNPSDVVDKLYSDYGPLLEVMRGKKWVLAPHVIHVEDGRAKANIFQVSDGYVIPVVFGGESKSVKVIICNLEGVSDKSVLKAIYPGDEEWTPLKIIKAGSSLILEVPLQRSCAMVRIWLP